METAGAAWRALCWGHHTSSTERGEPLTTNAPAKPDEIPFAEVFPLLLNVVLVTLTSTTAGIYNGLGQMPYNGLITAAEFAAGLTLSVWFHAYAGRHRIPLIMDSGWLILAGWPIA